MGQPPPTLEHNDNNYRQAEHIHGYLEKLQQYQLLHEGAKCKTAAESVYITLETALKVINAFRSNETKIALFKTPISTDDSAVQRMTLKSKL